MAIPALDQAKAPETGQDVVSNALYKLGAIGINAVTPKFNPENISVFPTIENNNDMRPYSRGIVEYDNEVSTIVLVTNKKKASSTVIKNYLTDFNNRIPSVIAMEGNVTDWSIVEDPPGSPIVMNNFSILDYQESYEDIVKITQNFSQQWNAFFFGTRPKVYTFSGILIDAQNYPYYEQFITLYESNLAGAQCAKNGYRLYMSYDGKIISGWLINMKISGSSSSIAGKGFSFAVLVDGGGFYRATTEGYGKII